MSDRKKDHLDLTEKSQFSKIASDSRFFYEPLLGTLDHQKIYQEDISFLGKKLKAPIWVGSMTGGTKEAAHINRNLAKMAGEFGFGMGLGSCRPLLDSEDFFDDFNVREFLGDDLPFYANLGVAQIAQYLDESRVDELHEMSERLRVDGLIIHINPAQEWFQPEGDSWNRNALRIIEEFIGTYNLPVIVKEVGQGMGPESLRHLISLPLAAIEFGAYGGTNFSYLELLRGNNPLISCHEKMTTVGHSAEEMVHLINSIWDEFGQEKALCRQFIISGGVSSYLDGYYLREKLSLPAIYGQANAFLKFARGDYSELRAYAVEQLRGLEFAKQFLRIRN
jgi:isopentenyl-diphosphate delta-isomerase